MTLVKNYLGYSSLSLSHTLDDVGQKCSTGQDKAELHGARGGQNYVGYSRLSLSHTYAPSQMTWSPEI